VAAATALKRTASALGRAPIDPVQWERGTILFSACNEDSQCEIEAFGSLEGKRLLCITAGGGRVLNLLAQKPKAVWAVDLNPAQNALLELKIAGMRALNHAAYLEFLGVRPSPNRIATYERVRPGLSDGARGFFDANLPLVSEGVLLQGKLERFLRRIARVLRVAHPFGVSELFAFDDIVAQRAFMKRFDTLLWRKLVPNLARRWVMQVFSGDPGFWRYVPESIPLHQAIFDRVHQYFWNHLARENHLMQLVFFGRYIYEPALPIYLNAATYERTKAALQDVHIETITARVDEALEFGASEAFDAFSLSDISSYLDDEAHAQLFDAVLRCARPGAVLCSRSNIYHRDLLPEQAARIERATALERQLAIDDHSCVHEFLVGTIR
jgi:S-adenosylmethionine-diacylglycerol 3-amino-3-carboxypropyl transferase